MNLRFAHNVVRPPARATIPTNVQKMFIAFQYDAFSKTNVEPARIAMMARKTMSTSFTCVLC